MPCRQEADERHTNTNSTTKAQLTNAANPAIFARKRQGAKASVMSAASESGSEHFGSNGTGQRRAAQALARLARL
eukprot:6181049-Pleurochrysis_carterae.AAC.2